MLEERGIESISIEHEDPRVDAADGVAELRCSSRRRRPRRACGSPRDERRARATADAVDEARRVLAAAAGLRIRLLGGLAIAVSLPHDPLLPRTYNDIDFITARGEGPKAAKLFEGLGYDPDHQFNGLNGHRRLLFYDTHNDRRVDVFVGRFEMSQRGRSRSG